eukprot:g40758.t1
MTSELETNIVAVERVQEYTGTPKESDAKYNGILRIPTMWKQVVQANESTPTLERASSPSLSPIPVTLHFPWLTHLTYVSLNTTEQTYGLARLWQLYHFPHWFHIHKHSFPSPPKQQCVCFIPDIVLILQRMRVRPAFVAYILPRGQLRVNHITVDLESDVVQT